MEHLFKLKKDGKTVGWLLIAKGKVWGKSRYECDEFSEWDNWGFMFDTAHPFVTKDKDGKEVFEDNEVKMFSKHYKIVWCERELGWYLQDEYKAKIKLSHINKNHIELIEES
jgi:hypothetical protein